MQTLDILTNLMPKTVSLCNTDMILSVLKYFIKHSEENTHGKWMYIRLGSAEIYYTDTKK